MILSSFLNSYKFNDMTLPDYDTYKATLRMFLEFGLVQQFNIPYKVSGSSKVKEKATMTAQCTKLDFLLVRVQPLLRPQVN